MTFGHFFLDRTFPKEYNMFWINDQQSFLERRSFMQKVSKRIVQFRIPILIIALILLIPSVIGYIRTKVNYDILTYLPKEIDTMKGQDILVDQFGTGAFSFCVVENMD